MSIAHLCNLAFFFRCTSHQTRCHVGPSFCGAWPPKQSSKPPANLTRNTKRSWKFYQILRMHLRLSGDGSVSRVVTMFTSVTVITICNMSHALQVRIGQVWFLWDSQARCVQPLLQTDAERDDVWHSWDLENCHGGLVIGICLCGAVKSCAWSLSATDFSWTGLLSSSDWID